MQMGGITSTLGNAVSESAQSGSILAIFIALVFGIFVGFTPCVYPVLPMTVAYIGSVSGGKRLNGFLYSLIYVLGMAVVYCTVGVVMALTGGFLGSLWSNGWVLLALANFFLILALWQLGVVRLPTPQFLRGAGSRRSGALGALGVGAAAGLVVGPCTAPGLAAMIALIQSGPKQGAVSSMIFGIIVMFAYSLGLGSLVLICGTFSGFLASLPKSGRWLSVVEKAFAVLMILLAEFFLIHLGQNANFPRLDRLFTPSTVPSAAPVAGPVEPLPPAEPTAQPAPEPQGGDERVMAPLWELKDLQGSTVRLSDYNGKKAVLMVFFATWCAECMEEVPHLIEFQRTYGPKGIEVIGVALQQPAHVIQAFARDRNVNYRIVLDEKGAVARQYEMIGPPLNIGIDASGAVVYYEYGAVKDLDALAAKLMAGLPAQSPN